MEAVAKKHSTTGFKCLHLVTELCQRILYLVSFLMLQVV